MSNLDFLEGETPNEPAVPVEPVAEAAPEPTSGPVRGPDGKFTSAAPPVEAATPPAPEPAATPVVAPETKPEPGHIPITALLEERDKRKALEARVAAFESQQQEQAAPDRYEDPEGYEAYREHQIEQRLYAQRLNFSRQIAEIRHTPELVAQAHEWAYAKAASDPLFNQKAQGSQDPYEFAVIEFKRDQVLSRFEPSDYDQYLAWKNGNPVAPAAPPATIVAPPQSPTPPRSLATAPAAGGSQPGAQPVGPAVAFETTFKD